MKVEITLETTGQPIVYPNCIGVYYKCGFYCIRFIKEGQPVVHKYPIQNIFRIEEDYPLSNHGDKNATS